MKHRSLPNFSHPLVHGRTGVCRIAITSDRTRFVIAPGRSSPSIARTISGAIARPQRSLILCSRADDMLPSRFARARSASPRFVDALLTEIYVLPGRRQLGLRSNGWPWPLWPRLYAAAEPSGTGAAFAGALGSPSPRHPAGRALALRSDVLVLPKEVVRIELLLDLDQPAIVGAVGRLNPLALVLGEEVDVHAAAGIRR